MPMTLRQVSAGLLPFVDVTFSSGGQTVKVHGLIDSGSPVTMITPELRDAVAMVPCKITEPIVTTGVDGQPTRMAPCVCASVSLGTALEHTNAVGFAGLCPMMRMVGWEGTPAALIGLDWLQQPKASRSANGGGGARHSLPADGRLVLDFASMSLLVVARRGA